MTYLKGVIDKRTEIRKGTYEAKYTLLELLNEGGNAWVCRCMRKDAKEEHAIKILKTGKQGEKLSRFTNEIAVMCACGGAINGVLPIIDADAKSGWYVMPIAKPIESYFEETKAGIKERVEAIAQLAQSLEALHEKGITHRDIKPDNLFRYHEGYCFGDFGLCEFPDGEEVVTRTDKQLGAFNTIAPEMYTNPQGKDGRKADVYSLAKTLWILLTGEAKGFSGPYSPEDSVNAFANFAHLRDEQLAFIELVLQDATDNSPRKRMPLSVFRKALETWTKHKDNSRYIQHYEWYLLMSHITTEAYVDLRHIFDLQQMIYVLNMIANRKILNHVMLPDGGGLDLTYVEEANEKGCIYLHMQMQTILVRPKALVIATFKKSDWNFIMLETEKQEPVTEKHGEYDEVVVEDKPGHYVSGLYARYGVYDYDSGEKLPEGYRILYRQLKGSFMIVPKQGYYNSITSTYDGRHSDMTGLELYQYVDELIKGKDPRPIYKEPLDDVLKGYIKAPAAFTEKYIEEVKIALEPAKQTARSRISFAFYVVNQRSCSYTDLLQESRCFLTNDGKFRVLEAGDEQVYRVFSRGKAKSMLKSIWKQFNVYYKENGYDFDELDCLIGITLRREGHLEPRRFTLEQIKELMRAADDRVRNKLVIDEYGRAKIIQEIGDAELYPVTQETWGAGNIYVGKYSTLSDAEQSYQYMLDGWLFYIEHSRHIYVDDSYIDVNELEKKINEYYRKRTKYG